jgi:hypothetical protein
MNLDEIKNLSNNDLLDLYTKTVQFDWYDPFTTPGYIKELRDNNI